MPPAGAEKAAYCSTTGTTGDRAEDRECSCRKSRPAVLRRLLDQAFRTVDSIGTAKRWDSASSAL